MFQIEDGTGTAYKAKVNKSNQLVAFGTTQTEMAFISATNADAYELHPPRFTNVTTTETFLTWLKNTSNDKNFHISRLKLWYNGGNTLTQRATCQVVRFYVGTETPSANQVTGKFGSGNISHNMNLTSTKNPPLDFRYWDNVGSGMTLPNTVKGEQLFCALAAQGLNELKFEGEILVPPGVVVSISALAEPTGETGNCITVISGYFKGHKED